MSSAGRLGRSLRLIGDVGGTNARFALLDNNALDNQERIFAERILPCADHAGLVAAIQAYLAQVITDDLPTPDAAVIAVATFTDQDHIKLTNLNWSFSVAETCQTLGLSSLQVVNDFTALALSLPHLSADELIQLGGEQPEQHAALALLGPGTGLGVSGLLPTPNGYVPLQGEGGHVSYGPLTATEQAVWQVLQQRYQHVSGERLLSGQGLVNIYQALRIVNASSQVQDTADLQQAADITALGLSGQNHHCQTALQLFCAILGTVAGDLALTLGAKGGVYIGGGIVPRLGEFFIQSEFRQRFEAHGRYARYLANIPVYIITAQTPALIGAAQVFDPAYASIGVRVVANHPSPL